MCAVPNIAVFWSIIIIIGVLCVFRKVGTHFILLLLLLLFTEFQPYRKHTAFQL